MEKKREFVTNRLTQTGRAVAEERHENDRQIHAWLEQERESPASVRVSEEYGLMGVINYFLTRTEDPNMREELEYIRNTWLPERRELAGSGKAPRGADQAVARVESFLAMMDDEVEGRIGVNRRGI